MDNNPHDSALVDRFGHVAPEVATELNSMLRMWDVDAEELSFKWESYCIQMGIEDAKMTLDTARAFKKHVQSILDKEAQARKRQHQNQTPRAPVGGPGADMFDQLIGATPRTGSGAMKRRFERSVHETPTKSRPAVAASSPFRTPIKSENTFATEAGIPFDQRPNAGESIEVLNSHIPKAVLPLPDSASWESRIRFAFNLDLKTFGYRSMYQKISEASETVDERIDEFAGLIQESRKIPDEAFGDPSVRSPSEIVAVGRIVSDALGDERTNASSVLLESSRMTGAGARTKLDLHKIRSYALFPGQIVAVRGVNSGGDFVVDEILEPPRLPVASATKDTTHFAKILADGPVSIVTASGPYTTDDNLRFESLDALTAKFAEKRPDVVILTGPFIDSEHPMVREGDFDLEEEEDGTLEDLFRERIAPLLRRLSKSLVFLVPSLRDSISKHLSYPQGQFKDKKALGLPQNCKFLPNPSLFTINDIIIAITSVDILFHLNTQEFCRNPSEPNRPARLTQHLLSQRSFYPLSPPNPQVSLDVPHLRLLDLVGVTPDVLMLPSKLAPFSRVVDGVVAINPGQLSKPRAAGTYVEMTVVADGVVRDGEERGHRVHERARVEVVRI